MNVELPRGAGADDIRRPTGNLAHLPERIIGSVRVAPSTRRLVAADGHELVVQPLVMQLLITLADNIGETLSRDDLVAECWGQRFVGDDAVNRAISHLRRDLATVADGSLRVETVPKVGYRLMADAGSATLADADTEPALQGRPETSYGRWLKLAIVFLLVVAGFAWWTNGSENFGAPLGRDPVAVTVMPIIALSDSPEEVALAGGITDELINRLRRVPELRVASAHASDEQALSPGHRIRASVRIDGNQIRVAARLEDKAGNVLWSDNFDRRRVDLFYVQEEIARAVADTLSVSLDVGINSRKYGGTQNPEAFAAFVEARALRHSPDRERYLQLLNRAITLDPNYARALFELNNAQGLGLYGVDTPGEEARVLGLMDSYSREALNAAPESWIGHASRSWYFMAKLDFTNAVREQDLAESRDPGTDPELYNSLANFHGHFGRVSRALDYMSARELIDPIYREEPGLTYVLFFAGRYRDTLVLHERSSQRGLPEQYTQDYAAAWSYLMLGERDAARALFEKRGNDLAVRVIDGGSFDDEDFPNLQREELAAWAQAKFGAGGRIALSDRAVWAAYLGEPVLAVEYLRQAYQRPGIAGLSPLWHPVMAGARRTKAFVDYVTELGMVKVWRQSGDWGDFCRPISNSEVSCE